MRSALLTVATLAAVATATPALAHDGPSVLSEAGVVRPGDRYAINGQGWFFADVCEPRVEVSRRETHAVPVGVAAVGDDGRFRFARRVPRDTPYGTRIVLDVTQYCDGIGTTRTVRIRVGAARRDCPNPLSVDETAYAVRVFGGLPCSKAVEAIAAFIDTDVVPVGWNCSHADPQIAGHDFGCLEIERPGRRVTARRVREV